MQDDGFDWDTMLEGTDDHKKLQGEIDSSDEAGLTSRLHKVLNLIQSQDEIEKFTIDDGLSEMERICWIIKYTILS